MHLLVTDGLQTSCNMGEQVNAPNGVREVHAPHAGGTCCRRKYPCTSTNNALMLSCSMLRTAGRDLPGNYFTAAITQGTAEHERPRARFIKMYCRHTHREPQQQLAATSWYHCLTRPLGCNTHLYTWIGRNRVYLVVHTGVIGTGILLQYFTKA